MSLESHLSADIFLHLPLAKPTSPTSQSHTILYFIPGNPGLINFYHAFLSHLTTSPLSSPYTVAGFSLGGFEISPSPSRVPLAQIQHPAGAPQGPIYSLRQQIDLTYRRVETLVEALRCGKSGEVEGDGEGLQAHYDVILIGHSVGAYIALEVIRRLHEEASPLQTPAFTVTGAILLTPTIVDIAKSSHGRVVTPLLGWVPGLDRAAQWMAWGLGGVLPGRVLKGQLRWVTGMEGRNLETVLAWLRSKSGVRQTVRMGGEEMREMREDGWGVEVWGGGEGEGLEGSDGGSGSGRWKAPKLVLYFARKDHWVDDVTREAIVKARRRTDEKDTKDTSWPRIEVDESCKLVHGWCLEQSSEVAEKVVEWVGEMMNQ
jgi:pimeloyl-ACP methyl ester carboxylesterase